MIPFKMRPDEILNEARGFNEKLAQGVGHLMDVGDIPSGVTPKEAVLSSSRWSHSETVRHVCPRPSNT